MRTLILAAVLATAVCQAGAEPTQQDRMRHCNAQAKEQALKGEPRKQFMKGCLSSKKEGQSVAEPARDTQPARDEMAPDKTERKLTAQQERMRTCNADAKQQALKGEARKQFMKACLSSR